jgi:hypothetical protein
MASLGFSLEHSFSRRRAPQRRGVGGRIEQVDHLIARREGRLAIEAYIGAALLGAAAGAAIALHGPIAALLHSLV